MPRTSAKQKNTPGTIQVRNHAWSLMYPFCKDVLGYKDMEPQPHAELCSWLNDLIAPLVTYDLDARLSMEQTKGLDLLPRGTFKTSVCTVGLALKVLEQNPNARILIDTHTWDFSCQILSEIKHHMENNDGFIKLFGDWRAGANRWAEDAVTIGRRTTALKEPSIDTSGVDKSKNGGHYDLIIGDDLHQERNSANEEGRKKVRDHIQNLYPILEPGGVLLLNGTRWHNADAYGWILQKNREAEKNGKKPPYRTLLRGAFQPDGTLYFPTRLTDEFLAQQRIELDDKKFAVWYLNKPIEESSKYFPESLIKFFTPQNGGYNIQQGQPTLEIF